MLIKLRKSVIFNTKSIKNDQKVIKITKKWLFLHHWKNNQTLFDWLNLGIGLGFVNYLNKKQRLF